MLDRALLQGLLRVDAEAAAYRFEHGLLHEALLERLRRQPVHHAAFHQTAEALLTIYGDEHPEVAARVADLFREAGEPDRAWGPKLDAVWGHIRRAGLVRAAEHLETARRWLETDHVPELDARRARVLDTEAHVRYHALEYDRALDLTREAAALFARLGDERHRLVSRWREAAIAFYTDHFPRAEQIAREVAHAAEAIGAPEAHLAWHLLAQIEQMRGRPEAAIVPAQKGLEAARRLGQAWSVRVDLVSLAEMYLVLNDFERARAFLDEAFGDGGALALEVGFTELFHDALTGRYGALSERLPHFIRDVEAGGGEWWLSALQALDAFVAVELRAEDLDHRVEGFIEAFGRVANDEPLTHRVMEKTAASLRGLGRDALAARVETLLAERRHAIAEALGENPRDA